MEPVCEWMYVGVKEEGTYVYIWETELDASYIYKKFLVTFIFLFIYKKLKLLFTMLLFVIAKLLVSSKCPLSCFTPSLGLLLMLEFRLPEELLALLML